MLGQSAGVVGVCLEEVVADRLAVGEDEVHVAMAHVESGWP
jgi:hypothetical protein